MDLIGEFRLHDVDNCNEIYCFAFHELRQLKGQLFFSLRVAVPSPPPPKVKRRRGNVYANLTLIAFPCLPFTLGGGGEEERLLILYRLGLREGPGIFWGIVWLSWGTKGGGECQSSLKEYQGGL